MKSIVSFFITNLILVLTPILSFAQISPAPVTGTTSNFLLYTAAGTITNSGTTSTYLGSIGTNAGTLSGFELLTTQPTHLFTATSETAQCATDLSALYADLVSRTGTIRAGVYGSETLTPGVYSTGGAITVATNLTLDGGGDPNARFIIKTGGAFTMAATAKILLTNGTQAKNVFWVITGAAAIAANCEARGTFICLQGAISMGANAVMQGSALTLSGAITTLDGMHLATADPLESTALFLSGNQTITAGGIPANLIVTGTSSPIIKWQSASNDAFTDATDIVHYSNVLSGSCIGIITNTTFFRAVALVDGVPVFSNSIKITTAAPAPVLTGPASFVLFTSVGAITNSGATSYLGNVGTHVGVITGFPNPADPLLHAADALTLACKNYLQDLHTAINAYPITNSAHTVAFGSGEILVPGVYAIGGAATMGGVLTLDGQNNSESLFIIKINGAFALAAGTEIKLINGASTDNVYWVVNGAIALGVNTKVSGTFIGEAGAIGIAANSVIQGKMFTFSGAITVANSTFTYQTNTTNASITTSGNQVVNAGNQPSNITITGATTPIVRWEKSAAIDFTNPITIANTTTTVTGVEIGAITAITYIRAVLLNGAVSYSPVVTLALTESAVSVAGTLDASQLICAGSVPSDLVLTGNVGFVTKWQRSLTADFLVATDIFSYNTTLSGIKSGVVNETTYFRAVVQNCTSPVAYSNAILITLLPADGGIVSTSQDFCLPSQPESLVCAGNSGFVIKWQSALTADFSNAIDIPNTTNTLTSAQIGLVSTTTYFRAVSQNCSTSISYAAPAVVTIGAITTWNGVSWTNGYPSLSNSAVFAADYTTTADIESCGIIINSGVSVIVGSGHTVILGATFNIDPLGSFTLSNNANLLQPEGVVNTGKITVNRESANLYRLDSTLWSSPVVGQNLRSFSPGTLLSRFYFYDCTASVNGTYATVFDNSLFPGSEEATYNFETAKGYLIRSPNTFANYIPAVLPATVSAVPGVTYEGKFTGIPNNGTIISPLNLALNGFNLVGNPYPSALSIDAFIAENSNTIDGTIWLWRKINDLGSGVGYATVTSAGLTSVQPGVIEGISSGIFGIGQGFFVKAKPGQTTANLVFNNSMRTTTINYLFYKNQNTPVSEKHRIWLNLKNATQTTIGQNLVGYITGATNAVDYKFDGKGFGESAVSLSSLVEDSEYNIQARSLPFNAADVVPLNFKTNVAGTYSISIDHLDGVFLTPQTIFLKDNLTGTLHNLKSGPYSFTSQVGNFKTRFELRYQTQLDVVQPTFDANTVVVYNQNGMIQINSGNFMMDYIEIYDVSGRLLFSKANVNATTESVKGLSTENQLLIIKIKSRDNGTVTKKIIH